MKTTINLQDIFLNQVRKDREEINITMCDGSKVSGRVKGFDNFTLVLEDVEKQHLIYKHAISYITPTHGTPISFTEQLRQRD